MSEFAAVERMVLMLIVNQSISIPREELELTFSRSSGPGGQNVNKVNTKVTLQWDVTHTEHLPEPVRARFLRKFATRVTKQGRLVLSSQRFRDQARNIDDCLERLKALILSVATAPRLRKATKPTRASQRRRLEAKKQRGQRKQNRGQRWE